VEPTQQQQTIGRSPSPPRSAEQIGLTRKIQEELTNVSNLVELHESNLQLLKDYEVRLVKYYQELLSNQN
jgi:hypothetical protein